HGVRAGVNWLVTPANVGLVEPVVRDCLASGAGNVLLLGYKGEDAGMRLGPDGLARLGDALPRLEGLPVMLGICLYPQLPDVPRLFPRADCGAGDEFLTITPDKRVEACSFHHESPRFETLEDLARIWEEMRARRAPARIGGCTRRAFEGARRPLPM